MEINNAIERMEKYVWEKLFYPETNLIYDLRTTLEPDGNISDLPTPEEISRNYPNACGWNTGMENSMINAGLMLDAVLNCYAKTGNNEMESLADKLFDGIKKCAEISGSEGFLARSISPFDKKSFYYSSSRDQYTHIVYSLVHYLDSPLCKEKETVKKILVSFAKRAEKNVTPETDYDMLRADGKRGIVTKLWGELSGHEYMRLPMIYLAAYKASDDTKWLNLYKQIRDEAIEKSYDMPNKLSGFFAYLQMQLSARILYELDSEYKDRYSKLMQTVAKKNSHVILENVKKAKDENCRFDRLFKPWRTLKFNEIFNIDGLDYYIPERDFDEQLFPLWDVADIIINHALCPDIEIPNEYVNAFYEMAECVDTQNHGTEAPIHFVAAYWNLI